jgi:hypothetical protein
MKIGGAVAMSLLGVSLLLAVPAEAGTIAITYDFFGSLTALPDPEPDGLHLQASATGPVNGLDPALSPVTFDTMDVLDFNTGLDSGTFTWTFSDGSTLFGTMSENDTQIQVLPDGTNIGLFSQALIFTGGTGLFTGFTGSSSSDSAYLDSSQTPNFEVSGHGFLTEPVPEPGSLSLMLGAGLIGAIAMRRRKTAPRYC